MRDSKWYSGLAFGLVVGLAVSAILFAWLAGGVPGWWNHDGTLVTSKDTLASWLTAIFSFVAAIFLWLTLLATQEMAKDTRRIGEAQVKAYLTIRSVTLEVEHEGELQNRLLVEVVNSGMSPAREVTVSTAQENNETGVVAPDIAASDAVTCGIQYLVTIPENGPDWALAKKVRIKLNWVDIFGRSQSDSFEYWLTVTLPLKSGMYPLARSHGRIWELDPPSR